jgi:hypothetical protein
LEAVENKSHFLWEISYLPTTCRKKVHPEFFFGEMGRSLTLKLNIEFIFYFKN